MEPYAVVVGAVNLDIWGRSEAGVIPHDSNPGEIRLSPGGVGRNIAHNLALLGTRVCMLTAFGDDLWAARLRESCARAGIDLSQALSVPEGRSSCYLYVTGPEGELAVGLCDADIVRRIDPPLLAERLAFLNGAALVVLDGNLTGEAIAYLAEHCTAPLFADPVSVTKARKLAPVLPRLHTIKPNALEAQALTGLADPAEAAGALVRLGVQRAFVSDGANGIFAADRTGCRHVPCARAVPVNVTGAGDAALAALCRAHLLGYDTERAARFAAAAGALAAECSETISPQMDQAHVLARMA